MRKSSDPELAKKLVDFLTALERGRTVKTASAGVSLDPEIAVQLLRSVKAQVTASADRNAVTSPPPPPPRAGGGGKVGKLTAYSDGASRGNPGDAACAVIFFDEKNEELLRRSKKLGVTTNNVAEYEGVLLALEFASMLGAMDLEIKLDSELVVKQLNRQYKVKHPTLKPLYERARILMGGFHKVNVSHVSRVDNKLADKLANDELDGKT